MAEQVEMEEMAGMLMEGIVEVDVLNVPCPDLQFYGIPVIPSAI